MGRMNGPGVPVGGAALATLSLLAACGGGGGAPPAGPFAGGFLGLANVERNVTQCGECHADEQDRWAETDHAKAFATLASIGREGPEESCAGCHNVSERGNGLTDPTLGFTSTPVARLHNVQCENCHGPGATHVNDRKQHPEATLAVGLDEGCGECHQDEHHPFVEEWQESAHARSHLAGEAFGNPVAQNPQCAYCHVAQSFIRFIESGGTEKLITADPLPITCVACHDPHGNGQEHQVRRIAAEPIVCGQCHQQGPDTVVGDTPHHPQRDMLLGDAGFGFGEELPGAASHGDLDANPDLCVTCHVVTKPFEGGEVSIPAEVGHTFEAVPVKDKETGERNFENCLDHHSDAPARFASQQARVNAMIGDLKAALHAVPEGERDTEIYTGALFNLETVENDGSTGVHNPALTLRLLQLSLEKLGEL